MRVTLDSLLRETNEKTTENNQYSVLTSSKSGIFLQSDYFNKQVASKDNTGYKVIRRGQFTYRAMSDTGEFFPNMLDCTDIGIVSPAYPVFEIIDQNVTVPEYLKYFFKSKVFQNSIASFAQGSTRTSVKFEKLKTISIDLPSTTRQRQTIEILDKASRIVTCRAEQTKKLDDLIKARFVEMFGDPELNPMEWPVEALGDVLSVEPQNGLYKPQSDYVQDGTGIPILRIDAFYDGKVNDFSRLKRLNCTDTERSRYLLMENDVVINRVNSLEYLGKCAWITGLIEPTVFESNMMRFHVDESRIDPCYMTRLLCSTFIYKQILNRAKKAVNQASINQGDVQSFKILVPPIKLQKQFAAFVAQIDKSKSVIQKSLDETQLLFDGLMQKYFG